jgi:hypothetical protein
MSTGANGGDTAATEDAGGRPGADRDEPSPQIQEALRVLADLVAMQAGGAGSFAEAPPAR